MWVVAPLQRFLEKSLISSKWLTWVGRDFVETLSRKVKQIRRFVLYEAGIVTVNL